MWRRDFESDGIFPRENTNSLKEMKDELGETNDRMDGAEARMMEAEDATLELLELEKHFEKRLVDQEGEHQDSWGEGGSRGRHQVHD